MPKTKQKARRGSWPEVYKVLATGALVAYSALGSRVVVPANAQVAAPAAPAQAARRVQDVAPKQYSIPAGDLADVVAKISAATGLRIYIVVDELRTTYSQGVNGSFTLRGALQVALKDTGAEFVFEADNAVRVQMIAVSETIQVVGAAMPSSPKYTASLRDTPQTIQLISNETIESQGAMTLRDSLDLSRSNRPERGLSRLAAAAPRRSGPHFGRSVHEAYRKVLRRWAEL